MSLLLVTLASVHIINECNAAKSSKIGVCTSPQASGTNCNDLNVLTSPTWYYNWAMNSTFAQMNCPSNQMPKQEFIPMIWGWYNQPLNKSSVPPGTTTILGFNEPNLKSQANLQPSAAVQGWKVIQSVFADKILVSPSASPCSGDGCIPNYGSQMEWFDEFFKLCNGECKVDYMAVHYYYCYPYDLIGSLQQLYNRYGYKIWLTEFDCPGGNPSQQKDFMNQLLPMIEAKDWIVKYAWFMDRDSGDESLLVNDVNKPPQLTALGQAYNTY